METTGGKPTIYKVKIQGSLDHFTALLNGDIRILSSDNDETLLRCRLNQAALRGFLSRLWDLNFTILAVEPVETIDVDFSLF